MNNFWYSLKEFKKSLLFKIIIVIQITIGITLLYRVNEIKDYENNKFNSMQEIINNKKIYKFTLKYDSIDQFIIDSNIPNKFSEFSADIQEKIQTITATYGEIVLKNFEGIEKFLDTDFKQIDSYEEYKSVYSLQCSPNFFEIFDIKLSEGNYDEFIKISQLDSSEFENINIPIVLGSSYREIFKVNDIIDAKYFTCKVVGFIEPNQFFIDKGVYELSRVKNLNRHIIVPISKDIMNANINNAFLIDYDANPKGFEYIKNFVDNLAEKHQVKLSITDPNENITNFKNMIEYNVNLKLIITYAILIFVTLAFIVIFANTVTARRKEFSVHIMHGATIKDICIRIILEHIFLVIIPIIISFTYLNKNNTSVFTDIIEFQPKIFGMSVLIIMLIVFLVALIPIYSVKKRRLNYLIKGE